MVGSKFDHHPLWKSEKAIMDMVIVAIMVYGVPSIMGNRINNPDLHMGYTLFLFNQYIKKTL